MKNYAGKSLEDQELRRLCIITCKEFALSKGYITKLSPPQKHFSSSILAFIKLKTLLLHWQFCTSLLRWFFIFYTVKSTYWFIHYYRIWSKLIMISAPPLAEDTDAQAAVEDLKPKMNKFGSQCVLYLLSFYSVFDNWESSKQKYTE